jgi:hypothetical protein
MRDWVAALELPDVETVWADSKMGTIRVVITTAEATLRENFMLTSMAFPTPQFLLSWGIT